VDSHGTPLAVETRDLHSGVAWTLIATPTLRTRCAGPPPGGANRQRSTIWLMLALLVACGHGEPAPPPVQPCRPATEEAGLIAQRLADGATEIARAQAVPLNRPVGQYVLIVAGEVDGEIGAWGVGPWIGGARILAVDAVALHQVDWGAAIADDSAAGKQRSQLARRAELEAARACVRADQATPPRPSR